MSKIKAVKVFLWNQLAGAVAWDEQMNTGEFQYDPDFVKSGLEISPLMMPLSNKVYRFPELSRSDTFSGLPGLIADSLPEKFGNALMERYLALRGIKFTDLTPVERLCYIGTRGMGALEFEPDFDREADKIEKVDVHELAQVAQEIMNQHNNSKVEVEDVRRFDRLIHIGTSAGGAKAKAIIAWNESTNEIMSGQGACRPGFEHWLLKFSEVENAEHFADKDVGRLEYAYYRMAVEAGISMMESRLIPDGERAHFMTRRFDREDSKKRHVHSFCGMAHEDRNPVGNAHYETLFATARKIGLKQTALDELFRRMVFNILARNQDDHSKNHAFMMDGSGQWHLTPAYDIVFTYKKGSRWVESQQMRCNGKRDNFVREDLLSAGSAADVKNPEAVIREVIEVLKLWPDIAAEAGLKRDQADSIQGHFRFV
jgi:serine/threonine-protein kinase HipA